MYHSLSEDRRITWVPWEIAASLAAILSFVCVAWIINSDRPDLAALFSGRAQYVEGEHPRNGSLLRLGTGDVQITLSWQADVDLDLHVIDPSGAELWFGQPRSRTGGELDVDANAACEARAMMTNPVENVFWPYGGAPRGHFVVSVHYFADCIRTGRVPYTVTVKRDGVTSTFPGQLSRQNDLRVVMEFDR